MICTFDICQEAKWQISITTFHIQTQVKVFSLGLRVDWIVLDGYNFDTLCLLLFTIGHNSSYVWHEIWSVEEVIHRGFQWSIGTLDRIPVWNHNWLCTNEVTIQTTQLHVACHHFTMRICSCPTQNNEIWW